MTPSTNSTGWPGPAEANVRPRYIPDQLVWLFVPRLRSWRPGIVLHGQERAVTVRYRPTDGAGTVVDTVRHADLVPRRESRIGSESTQPAAAAEGRARVPVTGHPSGNDGPRPVSAGTADSPAVALVPEK